MNKFEIELEKDIELKDSIQINYFENRIIRRRIAEKKWNQLFSGEVKKTSDIKTNHLDFLNKYMYFTKGNPQMCTRLLKTYFLALRKKIEISLKSDELLFTIVNENITKDLVNQKNFPEVWNKIHKEIDEELDFDYKKLLNFLDYNPNLSVLARTGWDLSKFNNNELTILSKLDEKLIGYEEIQRFLKKIFTNKNVSDNRISEESPKYINEFSNIYLSNDLKKILLSELSLLKNRTLKKVFYTKYIEKNLLSYSMEDRLESKVYEKTTSHLNPFIICIDTSSSMIGLPEVIAKSIVLYLLNEPLVNKRKLFLISFGSANELYEYNLFDNKYNTDELLNFLTKSFHGGTDFNSPIEKSLDLIQKNDFIDSDILFITDGQGKSSISLLNEIQKEKNNKRLKIFSVVLNRKKIEIPFCDESLYYKLNQ